MDIALHLDNIWHTAERGRHPLLIGFVDGSLHVDGLNPRTSRTDVIVPVCSTDLANAPGEPSRLPLLLRGLVRPARTYRWPDQDHAHGRRFGHGIEQYGSAQTGHDPWRRGCLAAGYGLFEERVQCTGSVWLRCTADYARTEGCSHGCGVAANGNRAPVLKRVNSSLRLCAVAQVRRFRKNAAYRLTHIGSPESV